ncbi:MULTISPECIES: caspase family protein [unclassified Streptomyces]|uniref:caspase family protein n=1 Tax=unclassified Streptomyces TaxID=2593676 RepID=UPI00378C20E0
MGNTALVLGVGRFGGAVGAGEEPPAGATAWPPLPFVYGLLPELAGSLEELGYRTVQVVDPDESGLRRAIEQAVDSDGPHCRVLHLLSHGATDPYGDPTRIDVVPASGRVGVGTNVSEWISSAQTLRRPTLFLLDLCRSGRAARLPFLLRHAGRNTHAWVLAASGTDEDAYDGRFSRAVADVLRELSRTGLGTDPTREHVAFSTVARHVRRRVEAAAGVPQTVLATAVDLGMDEPDLPFFPNPRFREDPARRNALRVPAPLRAFLDDLTDIDSRDAGHFTDRAGAHFAGRRAQLRLLAPWLDDDAVGGLRVVTGAPGSGKSALLGALVCAAHTELAAVVPHIRARLQAQDPLGCPSQHTRLAAVHARQRTVDDVIASVVGQLGLPEPADGWQATTLIQALGGLEEPPPVVIDALDEAVEPDTLCAELLLPLARAARPDGKPVCRLLVGMRPWEQFARLRDAARVQDGLVDLDTVERPELRADLAAYLAGALGDAPAYASREQRPVRERLAAATADALVPSRGGTDEWGAFLVGSLLTGYLHNRAPARTLAEADDIAATVPATLPGVLDLDLALRTDPAALRRVLGAVALAKGDGMPAEVVARIVTDPRTDGDPDPAAVQRLLDEARFYLRTGLERDGTTLYRLFHQGLTDHLRRPSAGENPGSFHEPGEVLDRLLLGIGAQPDATGSGWGTAPRYLLRHTIDHAVEAGREEELITDAEFLVHADPDTLVPVLDRAREEAARSAAGVYRSSIDLHGPLPPESRRGLLAIDAARYRDEPLLDALRGGAPAGGWLPRWATGFGTTGALRRTLLHPQGVEGLTCTELDGIPVAITGGYEGVVRVWNLRTGRLHREPLTGHTGAVHGLACSVVAGRPVVASTSQDGTLRISFLDTGALYHEAPISGYHTEVYAATVRGRPAFVVVGPLLTAVDLESREVLYETETGVGWGLSVSATAVVRGRSVVVTGGSDTNLRLWDIGTGAFVQGWSTGAAVRGLACVTLGRRSLAFTGHEGGKIDMWDLARRRKSFTPLRQGSVRNDGGLACVLLDGLPTILASEYPALVRVWNVLPRRAHPPLTGHSDSPHLIASTVVDGEVKAVTGSRDGTARVWDLPTGIPSRRSQKSGRSGNAASDSLHQVACTTVDGREVAVALGESGMRMWDLGTGGEVGDPMGEGTGTLLTTTVRGRALAVTTGGFADPAVRVWDLAARKEILDPWAGRYSPLACTTVRGRPVAVRVGERKRFELRDVLTGETHTLASGPDPAGLYTLACTTVHGRPVALTGAGNGVLRVWDLESGKPVTDQIQAHKGELNAIACATAGGRSFAVTGYFGGAVSGRERVEPVPRVWDLTRRRPEPVPLLGHTGWVTATAFTVRGGRPVAVTGGQDARVKLWDVDGTCLATLEMPAPVSRVAVAESGALAVVVRSGDLIVMEPAWEKL